MVLQILRTKSHLPDRIKDTIQNATSMAELFKRIEQSVPELESAVSIVIKRICAQKHLSSQEPHVREARATELTLALQDLSKLFPERELNKSEAISCLASLQPLDSHIMATATKWNEEAKLPGGTPIK